jgi:hypothetical protein
MKKVIVVLALSGCSMIPSHFDNVLYDHITVMSVDVTNARTACTAGNVLTALQEVQKEATISVRYTQYASKDVNQTAVVIEKSVSEMVMAYSRQSALAPSAAYCNIKLQIIDTEVQSLLQALGGKL